VLPSKSKSVPITPLSQGINYVESSEDGKGVCCEGCGCFFYCYCLKCAFCSTCGPASVWVFHEVMDSECNCDGANGLCKCPECAESRKVYPQFLPFLMERIRQTKRRLRKQSFINSYKKKSNVRRGHLSIFHRTKKILVPNGIFFFIHAGIT